MEGMLFKIGKMAIDEECSVIKVKLLRPGFSVVVAELRSADQMIGKWFDTKEASAFNFEVTFDGGCSVYGRYEFSNGKKRRPSLSRFVRETLKNFNDECLPTSELSY